MEMRSPLGLGPCPVALFHFHSWVLTRLLGQDRYVETLCLHGLDFGLQPPEDCTRRDTSCTRRMVYSHRTECR